MSDRWLERVASELGVDADVPADALLDAGRVVAHSVERKATPLTAYLMGLAVEKGADPLDVCRRVVQLAREWEPD